ncbi:hypothetical protein J2794_006301 [Paraburkholderia terricola]|uniref:hypothetical protein n=1 Tax=Paraburkholderia terricola TaxID=169427 RepID=UPI00285D77F5|nr:hypothetical protein [Paraburkholderia terricola]MDR6450161.1 hypothetical protein [Paraburkholderia terricola]
MEVNLLKAITHVTADRRPVGARVAGVPGSPLVTALGIAEQLTSSERDALEKA